MEKIEDPAIKAEEKKIKVKDGLELFVKILSKDNKANKTCLYIHGGAFAGNHTMIERPAKWLMQKDCFDKMILIDRRGDGRSSNLSEKYTLKQESEDIKILLDKLNIEEKLTAIGNSYGGPISLLLSQIDNRIEKVILSASSPTLWHAILPLHILFKINLLSPLIKFISYLITGRKSKKFIDLDFIYDLKHSYEYHKIFSTTLIHSSREELKNIYLKIDSVLMRENLELSKEIVFEIPVLQVIGDKDEFWGKSFPEEYLSNFPNLKRIELEGRKHRNVFMEAEIYHKPMIDFIKK